MITPSRWNGPVFLMNFPISVSSDVPNNALMRPGTIYDKKRACDQWLEFYRIMTGEALVYVLPGHDHLQDLPFVANLGCYLPHIRNDDVVLLSNYTSEPRIGEERFGFRFFNSFDYSVVQSPYCWEGEADLKWIRDNIYIGGIGMRSTPDAYKWMRLNFDMDVHEIKINDPKLYHLDCVLLPLSENKALVNVSVVDKKDLKTLESLVEVIPVPKEYVYQGWTNSIILNGIVMHSPADKPITPFADLLDKQDLKLATFDLTEFDKSGADLSCLVMHMNYR